MLEKLFEDSFFNLLKHIEKNKDVALQGHKKANLEWRKQLIHKNDLDPEKDPQSLFNSPRLEEIIKKRN